MQINSLGLCLMTLFLSVGARSIASQPTPLYFIKTIEYGETALFEDKNEYQKILDTKLTTEINPAVTVSYHSLKIDDDTDVNFSWYRSGKPELIVLGFGLTGLCGPDSLFKKNLPFVQEFTQHYDVIVFKYEWQNPTPFDER